MKTKNEDNDGKIGYDFIRVSTYLCTIPEDDYKEESPADEQNSRRRNTNKPNHSSIGNTTPSISLSPLTELDGDQSSSTKAQRYLGTRLCIPNTNETNCRENIVSTKQKPSILHDCDNRWCPCSNIVTCAIDSSSNSNTIANTKNEEVYTMKTSGLKPDTTTGYSPSIDRPPVCPVRKLSPPTRPLRRFSPAA